MSRRTFLRTVLGAAAIPAWAANPSNSVNAPAANAVVTRLVDLAGTMDASGTTDMSSTLQRAVTAAGEGGVVRLPAGNFLVTGRIEIPHPRQHWVGHGRGVTRIVFAPQGDESLFIFGSQNNISPQQSLRDLTITSADTTHRKTAVELLDTSDFVMRDVEITGATKAAGTFAWTGGSAGSIGVHTRGREAPRFGGGCFISADNPFRISRNPRRFSPQIDADFFSLRDVYMIAHGFPCILIDGDVELINFLVDGCALVRGTNAIKWIGTSATRAASSFSVRSSRWEQAEDPDAYAFDIQPNKNLYALSFDGLSIPPMSNGFRLRNCVAPSFKQVVCGQNTDLDVLNVDRSVIHMRHEECYWGVNSRATMTGQRVIWAGNKTSSREPLPRNALYDSDTNADDGVTFEGGLGGRPLNLPDRAVDVIGPVTSRGWLFVVDSEGAACQFMLRGAGKGVTYIAALDPAGVFSAVAGSAGKTNVYWSSQLSRYEIENLRGGTRIYRIVLIGNWLRN